MFQLFKKGGKKVGGLLLGIQIFLAFFVPVSVVYAGGSPTAAEPVCFSEQAGSASIPTAHCYANIGACTSGAGPYGSDVIAPCKDIFSTMTETQIKAAEREARTPMQKLRGVATDALGVLGDGALWMVGKVLELIAQLINKIAGIFMRSMGDILDMAIARTIDSQTYSGLVVVAVGWTAVRDLSNMFFIFVLLFIAIQTILGLAGGSAKRWLSHVIIAALLINFSLFLTGVVIDAGNVLAMGFWDKIQTPEGANGSMHTASGPFLQAFMVQTAFDPAGETSPMDRAMIYAGGALIMFVAGYVFLAGAVMMIIRTVTLLILMIVSPFAFLGFALPKGGGFAQRWLDKLIANAFVAPAFLAMLYLDALIISSTDTASLTGVTKSTLGAAMKGNASNFDIIYQFVIMIILLLASLTVANAVSAGAGSTGGAWAKKMIGGGAAAGFAAAGWAGRQTIGASGQKKLQDENWVKEQNRLVAKAGMANATFKDKVIARAANAQLAAYGKAAKGSFDIRNAPMGGLGVTAALGKVGIDTGKGSTKSFATHGETGSSITGRYRGTEKEKELIATAKARFPNNPSAQKAYLEQNGVQLESADGRNKDVNAALNRDIKKATAKETIDAQTQRQKEIDAAVAANTMTPEAAAIEGAAIAKEVGKAMQTLTMNERAEMAEKYKGNNAYLANMSKADLAAVHRMEIDGKFKEPVMKDVSQGVLNLKGDQHIAIQQYIMNDETQEKLFSIDGKTLDQTHYNKVKDRVLNKDKAHEEALKINKKMEDDSARAREEIVNKAHGDALIEDRARAQAKKVAADAAAVTARKERWNTLFAKGANRTPAEEEEMKKMGNA